MTGADNEITLVTGASGSIGRATVRALAARRCPVVTVDRRALPEPEASLALRHLECDLEDDAASADGLASLTSEKRLRHVIAIAGGGDAEELAQADPATEDFSIFSRVVANNLHTAFVTVRNVVPPMRAAGGNRLSPLLGRSTHLGLRRAGLLGRQSWVDRAR